MENRAGLIGNAEVFEANGTAERDAALVSSEQLPGTRHLTAGAGKAYDTEDFVAECRGLKVTQHAAQNQRRRGGIALGRRTRPAGYGLSQGKRKRIEESFGWLKTIARLRKMRHSGMFRAGWVFTFAEAGYQLVRMQNLLPAAAGSA